MENKWIIFTVLSLLVLWICKEDLLKIWRALMLWVHIASGGQLFKYVMIYSPEGDPPVPEEERDVMGIVFSNDEEYMDKIIKIMEEKEK